MPFNITNSVGRYAKNKAKKAGIWVAVGSGSKFITSTDGNDWKSTASTGGITQGLCLAYGLNDLGDGLWLAGGFGGSGIARSTDGNNWVSVPNNNSLQTSAYGIQYGKDASGVGLWVSSGDYNNTSRLSISRKGTTEWTSNLQLGGISLGSSFVYANNLWVACGQPGNSIATSSNGTSWTGITANGGLSTFAYRVAYGQDASGAGLWIVVGEGANTIARSTSGTSWTGITANGGVSTSGRGVAYGKDASGAGLWVVVGNGANTIATSTNGTSWTGITANGGMNTSGLGVAYGQDGSGAGLWIAVGTGTNSVVKSTNGTNWTAVKSNSGFYASYLSDVKYSN